jgi:hypothetical protein
MAWKHRGNDFANQIPEERMEAYIRELAEIEDLLLAASQKRTLPAHAYLSRIGAMESVNKPDWSTELFREAIAKHPEDFEIAAFIAARLLPQWGGDRTTTADFLWTLSNALGGDEGDMLYARVALSIVHHFSQEDALYAFLGLNLIRVMHGSALLSERYPNHDNFCRIALTSNEFVASYNRTFAAFPVPVQGNLLFSVPYEQLTKMALEFDKRYEKPQQPKQPSE